LHEYAFFARRFQGRSIYILLYMLIIANIPYDFFREVRFKCSTQCVYIANH
jgi:hypothetical protein